MTTKDKRKIPKMQAGREWQNIKPCHSLAVVPSRLFGLFLFIVFAFYGQ
jgi:hypothetical protein